MQLGILTFLRRSSKPWPPLQRPAAPASVGVPLEVPPDGAPAAEPGAGPVEASPRAPIGERLPPGVAGTSPGPSNDPSLEPARPARGPEAPPTVPAQPRPFHSERYGFVVTLPPGWRAEPAPDVPGRPTVERFVGQGGALKVAVWSEPCPVRALPPVPADRRAAVLPLAGGFVLPFVAYDPSAPGGEQFLEGRWLRGGRRWTCSLQLPAEQRAAALAGARGLLATLRLDG